MWGGWSRDRLRYLDDGALWDPATDTWARMTRTVAPSARGTAAMIHADGGLIVFGGDGGGGASATGGEYDLATSVWRALSTTGAPSARESPSMVWTGSEVLVWGG